MSHCYAIFSALYPPHTGGIETFTHNLAHELVRQGNQVHVVTSQLPGAPVCESQNDGVMVWRLPAYVLMGGRLPIARHSREYRRLWRQLLAQPIDRVLVNARFYRHSLDGLAFARQVGAPAVMLDHGSAYLTLGKSLADRALQGYEHLMTRLGKRYKPHYAGISGMSARWLKTFGVETERVIPNAIDAAAFRAESSGRDFRSELALDDNTKLVAFVGRLEPEKGAEQLAQAAKLLGPQFAVLAAGDGTLATRIQTMQLENFHLVGRLNHADLSALLSQADLFCLPTRSEGFCTALLECGAWGTPPVMPQVGGMQEVAGNPPICGAVLKDCEPQTIARALTEAAEKTTQEQREKLISHVEQHCSWPATAQALDQAFER